MSRDTDVVEPKSTIVNAIDSSFGSTVSDCDAREGLTGGEVTDGDKEGMDAFVLKAGGVLRGRDVELGPDYGHICCTSSCSDPILIRQKVRVGEKVV
jgi:hypothetical protein